MNELQSEQSSQTAYWNRIALVLVSTTLVYNVLEAVIALWAGAGAHSVALLGFGFDSGIETAAATLMLYRLWVEYRGANREQLERLEHIVHRFVGTTLLLLATFVILQSAWTLWNHSAPEESTVGIALATVSLVIMPLVSWGKLRAARELKSASLRAEAKETLACAYLSLTLLIGLVVHTTLGWWWADPVAALLMVPWLIMEGLEGVRGEDCCIAL